MKYTSHYYLRTHWEGALAQTELALTVDHSSSSFGNVPCQLAATLRGRCERRRGSPRSARAGAPPRLGCGASSPPSAAQPAAIVALAVDSAADGQLSLDPSCASVIVRDALGRPAAAHTPRESRIAPARTGVERKRVRARRASSSGQIVGGRSSSAIAPAGSSANRPPSRRVELELRRAAASGGGRYAPRLPSGQIADPHVAAAVDDEACRARRSVAPAVDNAPTRCLVERRKALRHDPRRRRRAFVEAERAAADLA